MKLFSCWLAAFSAPLAAVTTFMIVVDFVQAVVVEPLPCEGCDDSEATTNPPQSQGDYKPLAQYWAPRIYHDTDDSYIVGDYITKINFDGDYNSLNNWENLAQFDTVPAYVYYSVSETLTHYFIFYGIFHPRDWHEWLAADQHENDFEGVMLCVKKTISSNGSTFGDLVAMETQAHDQFYQYKASGQSVLDGSDTLDGTIQTYGHRPQIFVEAKGHGIYNCDSRCSTAPGGDGIVYYEGDVADFPSSGSGNWLREYRYKLIAMDASSGDEGLWHRRFDICANGCTYAKWGVMRGDNYGNNKANLPFIWDDLNDGEVYSGDMLCDPAYFFDAHLNGEAFDNFSHTYINHIYRTHQIRITHARSDKGRDPFGGDSDIYVQVEAANAATGTNKIIDARNWKRNDAKENDWYPWYFGGYDAEGQKTWSHTFNSKSFCRQSFNAHVTVKVMDSDNNLDDFMGSIVAKNGSASYLDGIDLGDGRVAFELKNY